MHCFNIWLHDILLNFLSLFAINIVYISTIFMIVFVTTSYSITAYVSSSNVSKDYGNNDHIKVVYEKTWSMVYVGGLKIYDQPI